EKQDYEYIRRGKVNIFMGVEPKGGKRYTEVTDQRTKKDFALYMKYLLEVKYHYVKILRIVVDNLNTHNESSFYENFEKKEAKRILKKIEFHYTPTHASWLNVAEIEIEIMDRECTRRRIKDKEMLTRVVKAWEKRRNRQRKKIDWTFTKKKADKKLGKYYTE
ncbi:MAG TPA: IS630 family transposase, partial [Candidatus Nanoarchaeia archaeon]|nr:IS630 family transposase [Candidatus Nanoarchaeia archaeon]